MIEELLEQLGEAARAGATPAALDPIENPNGDGKLVIVREGYTVHPLPGERQNARTHVFGDIASLAAWLTREVVEDRRHSVDLLVAEKQITAHLDSRNPCADVVTCPLVFHPSYVAWSAVFGKALTQKEFHAFIRGQIDTFAGNAGDQLANEITKINLISGRELTMELDPLGYHRVHGSTSKAGIDAALPPRFQIVIPILLGVREEDDVEAKYVIDVFLSADVVEDEDGDKAVKLGVAASNLPLVLYEARLDAVAYLKRLAVGFDVMLGQAATKEVPA